MCKRVCFELRVHSVYQCTKHNFTVYTNAPYTMYSTSKGQVLAAVLRIRKRLEIGSEELEKVTISCGQYAASAYGSIILFRSVVPCLAVCRHVILMIERIFVSCTGFHPLRHDKGPAVDFSCQRTDPERQTRAIVSSSLYWGAGPPFCARAANERYTAGRRHQPMSSTLL